MADKTDAYELKEAEVHWEEIMERVEAGEEIVLMRDGVAVAKLVPVEEVESQ
ncbi:MAG: type II toxin-antitoxin system Phd/YefM family antitoxin [Desulfocurvibacter africanus]